MENKGLFGALYILSAVRLSIDHSLQDHVYFELNNWIDLFKIDSLWLRWMSLISKWMAPWICLSFVLSIFDLMACVTWNQHMARLKQGHLSLKFVWGSIGWGSPLCVMQPNSDANPFVIESTASAWRWMLDN